MGTEQFGHRQSGSLGFEVPERDVDGGDGLSGHTAAADRSACPDQLGPDLGDIAGVLANQDGGDFLGVGELGGTTCALGVTEPDPFVTVLGAYLGERKTTSVIGFWRPVSTLASLIGLRNGSTIEDSLIEAIASIVAAPGANGLAAAVVVVVLIGTSFVGWDFSGVSVRR